MGEGGHGVRFSHSSYMDINIDVLVQNERHWRRIHDICSRKFFCLFLIGGMVPLTADTDPHLLPWRQDILRLPRNCD